MSEAIDSDNTKELKKTRDIKICRSCGVACDPYSKPGLSCTGCDENVHMECLKRGIPASFMGDVFFEFTCASCSPLDEETVVRDRMSWLAVIVLALYNLRERSSGISKRGYFHWKNDISTFVEKYWDVLFQKTVKKKKNWIGTISGTLSHYNEIFFKSGTKELQETGWWKLLNNDPPEILIAKNSKMITDRKKNPKLFYKSLDSPVPSDSSVSMGDDSNCSSDLFKNRSSMYSSVYVQPTETISDFLLEDDEPTDMEEDIMLRSENNVPSISQLIQDCQYENSFSDLMDRSCDWWYNPNALSPSCIGNDIKKQEGYNVDSNSNSSIFVHELPVSLFKETSESRQWPWSKSITTTSEKIPRMTRQEETYLLQKLSKTDLDKAPPAVRRQYRKLALRKRKREYGFPLFDVDNFGSKSGPETTLSRDNGRVLDRFFSSDDLGCIFEQRLLSYNESTPVHSPYTHRRLKPFIRRDISCDPLWLRIMEELCRKANKNNPHWKPPPRAPIDYSYIRPQHVPAINNLCRQFFWPGIDMTECLQYPDFTCVVSYKKLVIGFAILVPYVSYNEAYISFLLTRPEWRKSGIGTFMLYHLIQTCLGQDVTLHVSATNPALILYQKLGFKIQEFVQDFYDKYMTPNSRECRHALFLRLSR